MPIRQIKVDGDIAYIPLTKGYTAIIDACDVHLVSEFYWRAKEDGRRVYAARNVEIGKGKRRLMLLHRAITDAPKGSQVDHINRDGLDNRRCNLRVCTNTENQWNGGPRADNTSGFRGVTWHKQNKGWHARIRCRGKVYSLGVFRNPEDAHAAYCSARKELFGEYAQDNSIECNDPGNPHLARAKGFLSGGEHADKDE